MEPTTPEIPTPEIPKAEDPKRPQGVERDNHWITILSMAIFVLLSLAAVAFLYYQNQQLKVVISNYQNITPPPTPSPQAQETASPSASPKSTKVTPRASPSANPAGVY